VAKLPRVGTLYHIPGDPFEGDGGRWSKGSPSVSFEPNGSGVTLEFPVSVAASYVESVGNSLLLGRELPFVWFDIKEKVSCNGAVSTVITYSDTPSLSVYRGGAQVFTDRQTNRWGDFFASGTAGLTFDP